MGGADWFCLNTTREARSCWAVKMGKFGMGASRLIRLFNKLSSCRNVIQWEAVGLGIYLKVLALFIIFTGIYLKVLALFIIFTDTLFMIDKILFPQTILSCQDPTGQGYTSKNPFYESTAYQNSTDWKPHLGWNNSSIFGFCPITFYQTMNDNPSPS